MPKAKQIEIPGIMRSKPAPGEPKVRLHACVTIDVKDTWTGEKISQKIPLESDDPAMVQGIIEAAINHEQTRAAVMLFVEKRKGSQGTEEDKERKVTPIKKGKKVKGDESFFNGPDSEEKPAEEGAAAASN